jgi:hypothetical protein
LDLRKLFKGPVRDKDTQMEYSSSKLDVSIRSEYMEQILAQLRRYHIPGETVTVEIREIGQSEGHPVFQGMLRLVSWQRKAVVRLLLGFPLIESSVRKAIAASWLEDVSRFDGLWLHTSSQFGAEGLTHLRTLILTLESVESSPAGRGVPEVDDNNVEAVSRFRDGS